MRVSLVCHQNEINILILLSAELVRNTKREKAGWLVGMGAENHLFSDESKSEVAQHAYFQEMLGMVVSGWVKKWHTNSEHPASGQRQNKKNWSGLTACKTLGGLVWFKEKYDERHNGIAKLSTPSSQSHDSTLPQELSWEESEGQTARDRQQTFPECCRVRGKTPALGWNKSCQDSQRPAGRRRWAGLKGELGCFPNS